MADVTEHHVTAATHVLKGHGGKVGPLPVWAWGAILGVGVAAWLYFHNKNASAPADTNPSAATSTGDQIYPDLTANNLGTPGNLASGGNGSNSADTTQTTNAEWVAEGVAYMIGRGRNPITTQQALDRYIAGSELTWDQSNNYVTPVVTKFGLPPQGVEADSKIDPKPPASGTTPSAPKITTNAEWKSAALAYAAKHEPTKIPYWEYVITRYLAGETLSAAQAQSISYMVRDVGPVPQALPKPHTMPAPPHNPLPHRPTPKPKTKTVEVTEWKYHTVVWGDTLTTLAKKYHTSVSALASKNHISNPNRIYAGHRLLVPVQVKKTVPA